MGQARERDGRGRPLPVWQGCRVLAAGEIFVMNRQSADLLTADPETLRDGRIAVRLGSSRCGSRRGTGGLANDKRCRFVSGATSSHCSGPVA